MATLNGLPVYSINFNEDPAENSGIDFVSLVDYPAIESNWVAFSKEDSKKPLKFHFDQDKQILYGPILIPNKPIYRYDSATGMEFYVVFPKEVVERLVRKLQKQGKTINLNYQHQKDSQLKEAVIQEIWLTGKPDKSNNWGFDLEEGSGFVGAYIGDSKFWQDEVKSGNVRGFSIEGFLDMEMKKIINKTQMAKEKFAEAKTSDGKTLKTPADSMAVGVDIMMVNEDGTETACPDGEYTLENGDMVTVKGGKIEAINEMELTEDDEKIIQEAAMKIVTPIVKKLEDKIAELETKLSKIPGAGSATSSNDEEENKPAKATSLSQKQTLSAKLSVFRKKGAEVNALNKKAENKN